MYLPRQVPSTTFLSPYMDVSVYVRIKVGYLDVGCIQLVRHSIYVSVLTEFSHDVGNARSLILFTK